MQLAPVKTGRAEVVLDVMEESRSLKVGTARTTSALKGNGGANCASMRVSWREAWEDKVDQGDARWISSGARVVAR